MACQFVISPHLAGRQETLRPATGLEQRLATFGELKRESPRIAQHDQASSVVARLIVDDRCASGNERIASPVRIRRRKRDVQPERVHRCVIRDWIIRIAVDLDDSATRRIRNEMDIRCDRRLTDDSHPEVLDIPGRHRGGFSNIQSNVFETQRRHSIILTH